MLSPETNQVQGARYWLTVRAAEGGWEIALGEERLRCRTREEATTLAQGMAKLRWTTRGELTGVRIELTEGGAAGETLYGS
jgi:hypothetical protein